MVAVERYFKAEVEAEHPVGRPKKEISKIFTNLELNPNKRKSSSIIASYAGVSGVTLRKAVKVAEAPCT